MTFTALSMKLRCFIVRGLFVLASPLAAVTQQGASEHRRSRKLAPVHELQHITSSTPRPAH